MSWGNELVKIRRYLRDPDGNIWTEGLLRNLWNEVQVDLANKTNILEDVTSISVPPRFQWSYLHDWEVQFIPSGVTAYRALRNQGDYFAFSSRFEAQISAGVGSDGTDEGRAFTHPWEAWIKTDVGKEVPLPLPNNFSSAKWLSYDRDPISITSRRQVQHSGGQWVTNIGPATNYYHLDDVSNQIVLWPRPSTAVWYDNAQDEGMLTDIDGDTNAVDTGTLTRRTGTLLGADTGIAIDVVELASQVLLVYDIAPTEASGLGSKIDWPAYMTKYVRYGVLARAYKANTDGHIVSLAQYWDDRYDLGVQALKQFRRKRTTRTRRLGPVTRIQRNRRPRLPSAYPAV